MRLRRDFPVLRHTGVSSSNQGQPVAVDPVSKVPAVIDMNAP